MRLADRAEVLASHGWRPAQALRRSLAGSEIARTLFIDGYPLAMFGVHRLENGDGAPWALTTVMVSAYPLAFFKASQHVVRLLGQHYPKLRQCIDARHEQALRWVRRLGFRIDPPHSCGKQGLPFHEVTFRAGG